VDDLSVQQLRAEVIARKNLPTMPAVLARILQLVEADGSHGRDLIDVIERDQVLTGKILRLANSAFFGQSRRVATIPRAVVLLGFSTVRNLALSVQVWDTLASGVPRGRVEKLWEHSVATAVVTKAVAARLRMGDPDEAFTTALMHDVGRLVLAMKFREAYWEALEGASAAEPLDAVERAAFGVDHAEVGAWILEAWSLPPAIVEAVRLHHGENPRPGLPGLMAVVNRLLGMTDPTTGVLGDEAGALLGTPATLGITPEIWSDAVGRLGEGEELAALSRLEG
jgi:putative nucleotidyltransferase with HDIG domain